MRIFDFIFYLVFTINLLFGSSFINLNSSDKDKLLLEIIAYVIDKGHYNPKQMDDDFSKNVFDTYIEALDGHVQVWRKNDNSR